MSPALTYRLLTTEPPGELMQQNMRAKIPGPMKGFPGGSDGKESAFSAGDPGLIPGLGRSPGEGNSNPGQYPDWRIPWTEDSGRLQSTGLQRVGHD